MEPSWSVSKPLGVAACMVMAFTYVGLLYAPRFILRLPPPASLNQHMLRRFCCAAVSSFLALLISSFLLFSVWDSRKIRISSFSGAYGLRIDYLWQAVTFPFVLTALLYLGPLVTAALEFINEWKQDELCVWEAVQNKAVYITSDVLAWCNYVVAPLTEEFVFRACMIPLLLCGGFQPYTIVFLCPGFFSLAHLNHFWELCYQQHYAISKAALVVGHLVAPIVAHIFCNIMGLPNMSCIKSGKVTTLAFLIGIIGFFFMLYPTTNPSLYNDAIVDCKCWDGFCKLKHDIKHNYK